MDKKEIYVDELSAILDIHQNKLIYIVKRNPVFGEKYPDGFRIYKKQIPNLMKRLGICFEEDDAGNIVFSSLPENIQVNSLASRNSYFELLKKRNTVQEEITNLYLKLDALKNADSNLGNKLKKFGEPLEGDDIFLNIKMPFQTTQNEVCLQVKKEISNAQKRYSVFEEGMEE